jgi:ubiquinol-cytochrome c reductase cytochrome c subunit
MSTTAHPAGRRRRHPNGFAMLNLVCFAAVAGFALWSAAPGPRSAAASTTPDAENGRRLYVAGCASCHGLDGRGVEGRGITLENAGAASVDFYLTSGRMPASQGTGNQSLRKPPAYEPDEIADLVAYVASLGSGPAIPDIDPADGDLAIGQQLYTANCAACHNSAGSGGALGQGYFAPAVTRADSLQVAEAVRVGPGAMPAFGPGVITDEQLASITRYVDHLRAPDDRGGLSLGRIGPVTEGMVAWFVGMVLLVTAARWIGART